jgi:hypothetical protein
MKEAAFLMRECNVVDPFALTPSVWNKIFDCAIEDVA